MKTGSIWGDGQQVPAWPRHLIVVQLVLMYFMAGIQKFGVAWTPFGSYSALFLILQDPAIANADYSWLAAPPWYQFTQLSTFVTILWEYASPVILWSFWCRHTADRGGRIRMFTLRYPPHLIWAGIGVVFHFGIAISLDLGIFPWAMLATYAAFIHPDQWRLAGRWVGSGGDRRRAGQTAPGLADAPGR
jgi:hypothetical protein